MDDITPESIEALATSFDDMCNIRLQLGQEKYGNYTWLEAPTIQMLLEELADQVNYTRFLAVKLMMMANAIQEMNKTAMGNAAFQPNNPERD